MSSDPIYQLATKIRARLATMKVPADVIYGNEEPVGAIGAPCVEIARDPQNVETVKFGAVTSKPKIVGDEVYTSRGSVRVGAVIRCSAAATKGGFGEHDDVAAAWTLTAAVLCALLVIAHKDGHPDPSATCQLEPGEDGAEQRVGAAFIVRTTFPVSIEELTGYVAPSPLNPAITTKAKGPEENEISSGPGP